MSITIYKYRLWCSIDSTYEYTWRTDPPTTCPTDTSHTIDADSITIVDRIEENTTTIREESTPTGGHFSAETVKLIAPKNSTISMSVFWPYPVSVLSITFVTREIHRGDVFTVTVGKDIKTGAIIAPIFPATPWASQDYTKGQSVVFLHPVFGARVYTCIQDTVANETPVDTNYWRHGLEVTVSGTVIQNVKLGYCLKVDDGSNSDNLKRVVGIDKNYNKVYCESNVTSVYSPSSPSYIKQSVISLDNFEIGEPWEYCVGESKIGGSYIPTDVPVVTDYTNNSDVDKEFMGYIEYLF